MNDVISEPSMVRDGVLLFTGCDFLSPMHVVLLSSCVLSDVNTL